MKRILADILSLVLDPSISLSKKIAWGWLTLLFAVFIGVFIAFVLAHVPWYVVLLAAVTIWAVAVA